MKNKKGLKSAYDLWITKGYEHFSEFGPNQISIRKISVDLNQPRTSFYYYFENQDEFLNELLIAHWERVNELLDDVKNRNITTCTELFRVLENYPIALNFQNRLFKNREVEAFDKLFLKVYDALFDEVISRIVFEKYDTDISTEKVKELMLFTTEVWFSRLLSNKHSVQSKIKNLQDIMGTVSIVLQSKSRLRREGLVEN